MNVALVNPAVVLGLFASSGGAKPTSRRQVVPGWAGQVRARLAEKLRYRRALHELHQLDDRELDDLNLARADLPALAWRHANCAEALARA
jgi:uncharacterized protein YjiS (DUF1127 family)